jgi:hypothetical protein
MKHFGVASLIFFGLSFTALAAPVAAAKTTSHLLNLSAVDLESNLLTRHGWQKLRSNHTW